ncbi:MAG: glycine cleavage system protein GcvH [Deltaproteobacteria bacterium]|nr:glycine cleavage system protein GcvH [Deltaproteobacteria bacterium]
MGDGSDLAEIKFDDMVLYSREHAWARQEDGLFTVGISDFAQSQLGGVIYLELPQEDDEFEAGEEFGVVESSKVASSLFAPVGGRVVVVNWELEDNPGMVNEDPYGAGWIIKIQPKGQPDLSRLLDAAAYSAFVV